MSDFSYVVNMIIREERKKIHNLYMYMYMHTHV